MLANFRKASSFSFRQLHRVPKDIEHTCRFGTQAITTAAPSSWVPLTHPSYVVWGANTDVGKTLVSAGLASAAERSKVRFEAPVVTRVDLSAASQLLTSACLQLSLNFIKPVQTGFPEDCDARLVVRAAHCLQAHLQAGSCPAPQCFGAGSCKQSQTSNWRTRSAAAWARNRQAAATIRQQQCRQHPVCMGPTGQPPCGCSIRRWPISMSCVQSCLHTCAAAAGKAVMLAAQCLMACSNACVAFTGRPVSDADLQAAVLEGIQAAARQWREQQVAGLVLLETAGGPASPAPSGTLQVRESMLIAVGSCMQI